MFALQNDDMAAPRMAGLRVEPLRVAAGTTKFDLFFAMGERGGELRGAVEYDADLYDASTIRALLDRMERLLAAFGAAPDTRVGDVPLAGESERARMIQGFNQTAADYPRDATLHALFEARAAAAPDAVALIGGDARVSYRALDRRANTVARALRGRGVAPGQCVGVHLDRGADAVAAILGVLKAGAAYLPLDPAYPAERLAYMLNDAGARVVLSSPALAPVAAPGVAVLPIGGAWNEDAADDANVPATTGAADAAYRVYTSGSTGLPKGVAATHRGVVNRVWWMQGAYPWAAGEVACQKTALSFVDAVAETFAPLLAGVPLAIVADDYAKDPRRLAAALAAHGVTRVVLVPSLLRALLETHPNLGARLPSLRLCVSSGERLPAELCAAFRAAAPGVRLLNLYGSSEVAADATCYDTAELAADAATVPVGRPIANTRVYVLDAALQPLPAGVPGEVWVGGDGVALGYPGRPELTAERFVTDPFSADPAARLYRTGDVGRMRADGVLELRGRADAQVKVRGVRVEPGEVEAALAAHPSVRQAVVIAREDVPGEARLVAYVTGNGEAPSAVVLRAHLAARLPAFLVPSAFVALDALPLTPSGKVDRRALPAPEAAAEEAYVAPATPMEQTLAAIWAEVLRVERVGSNDSFFALGGHSLLATRVVSRLRAATGVELPVREIFTHPTLCALAARADEEVLAGLKGMDLDGFDFDFDGLDLDAILGDDGASASAETDPDDDPDALLRAPRADRTGDFPVSFQQQRLWFLHRMDPETSSYHVPLALRLRGALDTDALRRAVCALVDRHEALRTCFPGIDGQPVQRVMPADAFSVAREAMDVDGDLDAGIVRMASDEAARPFALEAGLPFRARLVRMAEDDHLLLLTWHHIAADGWSVGVMAGELSELYAAFRRGAASPLAPLAVQYPDYAAWQRARLQGDALDTEVSWWTARLGGAPTLLELPTDRPRPAESRPRGVQLEWSVPAGVLAGLKALSRAEGATLYMTLLATLQVLLSRWSGQDDVVVGTPIAGRTRAETEGLAGLFANTLALRADLSDRPAFRDLLRRVRETTLDAFAHQEVPFERLVDALGVKRSLSHAPVFQVMFALQPAQGGMSLDGVTVETVRAAVSTAKVDLNFTASERGDGLTGGLEYDAELFDETTARRMAEGFAALLAAFAADAGARVTDVPLVDADERARMLEEWNDTAAPLPALPVHRQVAARAAQAPDAPALAFRGETLSYAQLEARAEGFARALRGAGAGPESVAALAMERGPALVAAILGAWKAGAAYLPLDTTHPAERLRGMLDDARAGVVLADEASMAALPVLSLPLLRVEEIGSAESIDMDGTETRGDSLAYVLFTSGSTGRPKGVMIPHGAVANFLASMAVQPGMRADDALLSVTTPTFDISVLEMFLPLTTGARVVVADRETAADAGRLRALLAASGATVMQATPATWRMLLESGWLPEPGMKALCGGEPLPREVAAALAGAAEPWNLYGPTETTVWSTAARVVEGEALDIGRPIANTRAYVLDGGWGLVPAGVAGELYLAGAGVARGYRGRPGLTAERFLPDPFASVPGARMYRTGDRARWVAGGRLECLGRADQQVKVRGFRIEPGEVEAALAAVEGVRQAVVVARDDDGAAYLAAYVVPAAAPDAEALRAALRATLPEYMVPTRFMALDALPLTSSGKVDRRALPAPAAARGGPEYTAPATAIEQTLADIWAEVLGVERVGVHDNFFTLGGHSLLATRVVSRLAAATGVELAVRELFVNPTVAGLAPRVEDEIFARLLSLDGVELDALLDGAAGEEMAAGINHAPLDSQ